MSNKNKNKKQQSILLPVMFVMTVMLLLLLAGWQLAESDFEDIVPIENVEIEGSFENLSLSDVRQTITGVLDGGYFTVNLKVVRNALLELPWVEDASIRRQWPSGLHIKVIEKNAVAYWGDNSMLSSKGALFSPQPIDVNRPLPRLYGPDGQHAKVWGFLTRISADFAPMNIDITQLLLDERRAWNIKMSGYDFSGSVEVKLGRGDTTSRLQRLVRVLSDKRTLDVSGIDVIDMRYPNGFAMHSRNKETGAMLNKLEILREV